jgi:hypothetical protein
VPELTEDQRAARRQQARDAIEQGLRDSHHIWHQTPSRLDWAADYALDALGDLAAEILVDGTMMRSLTMKDGVATLELEPASEILTIFVASMRGVLDGHGAENYAETEFNTPSSVSMDLQDGQNPEDSYTVTIQRRRRPTPHEFRLTAERERDAAHRELVRIEEGIRAAIDRDREQFPEGPEVQARLGLLTALRIIQGDRFGAPKEATR